MAHRNTGITYGFVEDWKWLNSLFWEINDAKGKLRMRHSSGTISNLSGDEGL